MGSKGRLPTCHRLFALSDLPSEFLDRAPGQHKFLLSGLCRSPLPSFPVPVRSGWLEQGRLNRPRGSLRQFLPCGLQHNLPFHLPHIQLELPLHPGIRSEVSDHRASHGHSRLPDEDVSFKRSSLYALVAFAASMILWILFGFPQYYSGQYLIAPLIRMSDAYHVSLIFNFSSMVIFASFFATLLNLWRRAPRSVWGRTSRVQAPSISSAP